MVSCWLWVWSVCGVGVVAWAGPRCQRLSCVKMNELQIVHEMCRHIRWTSRSGPDQYQSLPACSTGGMRTAVDHALRRMAVFALVTTLVAAAPGRLRTKIDESKMGSSLASHATLSRALALSEWTKEKRRDLHRCPELLYSLDETSAYIRRTLDELQIPYVHPVAKVGIIASIGTGKAPCVGLRADMDALPIAEEIESGFKSQTPGKMHACGHDAHMSMLLAAARILKEREATIPGTVKLIFQPAEEGGAGGLAMVQAGLLESAPRIERVFALHVWPGLPSGVVATMPGTIMAAAGFYHATMIGRSHATTFLGPMWSYVVPCHPMCGPHAHQLWALCHHVWPACSSALALCHHCLA